MTRRFLWFVKLWRDWQHQEGLSVALVAGTFPSLLWDSCPLYWPSSWENESWSFFSLTLSAVNPGNGSVPAAPPDCVNQGATWPASLSTWPRATRRPHWGAKVVQKCIGKPLTSCCPRPATGHWGLGTCSLSILGSSLSDTSLSHQPSAEPGLSS